MERPALHLGLCDTRACYPRFASPDRCWIIPTPSLSRSPPPPHSGMRMHAKKKKWAPHYCLLGTWQTTNWTRGMEARQVRKVRRHARETRRGVRGMLRDRRGIPEPHPDFSLALRRCEWRPLRNKVSWTFDQREWSVPSCKVLHPLSLLCSTFVMTEDSLGPEEGRVRREVASHCDERRPGLLPGQARAPDQKRKANRAK